MTGLTGGKIPLVCFEVIAMVIGRRLISPGSFVRIGHMTGVTAYSTGSAIILLAMTGLTAGKIPQVCLKVIAMIIGRRLISPGSFVWVGRMTGVAAYPTRSAIILLAMTGLADGEIPLNCLKEIAMRVCIRRVIPPRSVRIDRVAPGARDLAASTGRTSMAGRTLSRLVILCLEVTAMIAGRRRLSPGSYVRIGNVTGIATHSARPAVVLDPMTGLATGEAPLFCLEVVSMGAR